MGDERAALGEFKARAHELHQLAKEVLSSIDGVARRSAEEVQELDRSGPAEEGVLEARNALRAGLVPLIEEPLVARIDLERTNGKIDVFLFGRKGKGPLTKVPHGRLVSYASPIGALAEYPVGTEVSVKTPRGRIQGTIRRRLLFRPERQDDDQWDACDDELQDHGGSSFFSSLRRLLDATENSEADEPTSAPLEAILKDHHVRTRIEHRTVPILDPRQGQILRRPFGQFLFLHGPPGVGKTATMMRRAEGLANDSEEPLPWTLVQPTRTLSALKPKDLPKMDGCLLGARAWPDMRRTLMRVFFGTGSGISLNRRVVLTKGESQVNLEDCKMLLLELRDREIIESCPSADAEKEGPRRHRRRPDNAEDELGERIRKQLWDDLFGADLCGLVLELREAGLEPPPNVETFDLSFFDIDEHDSTPDIIADNERRLLEDEVIYLLERVEAYPAALDVVEDHCRRGCVLDDLRERLEFPARQMTQLEEVVDAFLETVDLEVDSEDPSSPAIEVDEAQADLLLTACLLATDSIEKQTRRLRFGQCALDLPEIFLVDEVTSFTAPQLACVFLLFAGAPDKMLAGDFQQSSPSLGIDLAEDILKWTSDTFLGRRPTQLELLEDHRSLRGIRRLASRVRAMKEAGAGAGTGTGTGTDLVSDGSRITVLYNFSKCTYEARHWLHDRFFAEGTAAVFGGDLTELCDTNDFWEEDFWEETFEKFVRYEGGRFLDVHGSVMEPGDCPVAMNVWEARGLEFENVVQIAQASGAGLIDEIYMGLTRAVNEYTLIFSGDLPVELVPLADCLQIVDASQCVIPR